MSLDYETYQSPYSWRYSSPEMRALWSEAHKRRAWRRMWLALAETQAEFDLVKPEALAELRAHVADIDVPRALEIEAEIQHDLMAELKVYAAQAPQGGAVLHLGATSMDIEDNADALRLRQALGLLLPKLGELLLLFAERIETYADTPLIAFTHLQPAEPSTLGYRLALYAQDLYEDWQALARVQHRIRGKGFTGAVGTGAAYAELLGGANLDTFQARLSQRLDLPFYPVSSQVYPRRQDYEVVAALAGLGASLYKFAFDLRILQSPPIGELSEPFSERQIGSSAMPFKRNPINAEKINSLARALANLPRLAWDNAAHSLLERTLDDSANRRSLLPESFLICDELLSTGIKIVKGLRVDGRALAVNLNTYAPFAATERVLAAAVKAGADRQAIHERLRDHAMTAWGVLAGGRPNPLLELLTADAELRRYLTREQLTELMDASRHVGDAPQRALALAREIQAAVAETT